MTQDEWPHIKRLLHGGWPVRRDVPIDDKAYVSLLAAYTATDVATAIRSLLGVKSFTPTPSEIVAAVPDVPGVPGVAPDMARKLRELAIRNQLADAELERDRDRFDADPNEWRAEYNRKVMARIDELAREAGR